MLFQLGLGICARIARSSARSPNRFLLSAFYSTERKTGAQSSAATGATNFSALLVSHGSHVAIDVPLIDGAYFLSTPGREINASSRGIFLGTRWKHGLLLSLTSLPLNNNRSETGKRRNILFHRRAVELGARRTRVRACVAPFRKFQTSVGDLILSPPRSYQHRQLGRN